MRNTQQMPGVGKGNGHTWIWLSHYIQGAYRRSVPVRLQDHLHENANVKSQDNFVTIKRKLDTHLSLALDLRPPLAPVPLAVPREGSTIILKQRNTIYAYRLTSCIRTRFFHCKCFMAEPWKGTYVLPFSHHFFSIALINCIFCIPWIFEFLDHERLMN